MKPQTLIGLAIVALLVVIAFNTMPKPTVDLSPGWHTVIPCADSPREWCDDPNTLD